MTLAFAFKSESTLKLNCVNLYDIKSEKWENKNKCRLTLSFVDSNGQTLNDLDQERLLKYGNSYEFDVSIDNLTKSFQLSLGP